VAEEHRHWSVIILDIVYLIFHRETPETLWESKEVPLAKPSKINESTGNIELATKNIRAEKMSSNNQRTSRHPRFYRPFVIHEVSVYIHFFPLFK
jgi:hypothetical protein